MTDERDDRWASRDPNEVRERESVVEALARLQQQARTRGDVHMNEQSEPLPTEYQKARMFYEDHIDSAVRRELAALKAQYRERVISLERELAALKAFAESLVLLDEPGMERTRAMTSLGSIIANARFALSHNEVTG